MATAVFAAGFSGNSWPYVLDSDFYLGIRRIKAQFSESVKEEVIENDHEPLISREMFDAVQKRRDS